MKYAKYKMSIKAIYLYKIRTIIIAVLIAFICGVLMAFFALFTFIFICIISVLLIIIFFWYPVLLYKSYCIEFVCNKICITKGVFFLRKYYTSTNDINYVGKIITPLQKLLGIFTLCLYTKSGKIYLNNIEEIPENLLVYADE